MPKKRTPTAIPAPTPASGAAGGPANARGIDYQLDVAVFHALDLIGQHLTAPYNNPSITMEPRQIHGGTATLSDIRITSTSTSVEVKLQPTKNDISEWIARIANDPTTEKHTLIYSRATGTLIASLGGLIRLAQEAGTDTGRLHDLVAYEHQKERSELLAQFGPMAAERLQRTTIEPLPDHVLQKDITFRARFLAPAQSANCIAELKAEFLQAMKSRRNFQVSELISHLNGRGITLTTPAEITLAELPLPARNILATLQHCPSGLPDALIASILSTPSETSETVASLVGQQLLQRDGTRWRLLRTLPHIQAPADLLRTALGSLLNYITTNKDNSEGRMLLPDAIALTQVCSSVDPKAIITAFQQLEGLLKRTGQKYLVLELAELIIKATARPPRSHEDARAQAHALICGVSWVYQRTGDLETAQVYAGRSLHLGQDLNWDRNTAFCFKCLGRIFRLQAEQNPAQRETLLADSAKSIHDAIDQFSKMPEIGPTHKEVGDCYSLLARTYLVARNYEQARVALQKAYALIPANGSKDHLDLLILTGELYVARGNPEEAERAFTEALTLPEAADVQISEIFARGYYQRAQVRQRLKQATKAIDDFDRAATLWNDLEEYELSAKARWGRINLHAMEEDKPMLEAIAHEESYLTRVTAYDLYQQRYPAPQAVARRKQPSREQLTQLLKDARKQAAIEHAHR